VVLCPTRHKIGHFGDILQANLLARYGKTKRNTTKPHIQNGLAHLSIFILRYTNVLIIIIIIIIHQSKEMYYNTK